MASRILSFVSIWFVNVLKQSWKCPELKCLIKNKNCLFKKIQWSNVPPKQFFTVFSENTVSFFFKFCRIKKYFTYQNISLLIHFLCQRFFDVLLWVVEKHNKHKLFTSRAVMHCYITSFVWNVCCYFSSHVSNWETTMVFEKNAYPSLALYIFFNFLIKIDQNWSKPRPPLVTGLISDILGNNAVIETKHRRIWKNNKFLLISRKMSNFKIFSKIKVR